MVVWLVFGRFVLVVVLTAATAAVVVGGVAEVGLLGTVEPLALPPDSLLPGGVDGGGVDAAEEVVDGVIDLDTRCCCCCACWGCKRGIGSLA